MRKAAVHCVFISFLSGVGIVSRTFLASIQSTDTTKAIGLNLVISAAFDCQL